MLYAVLPVVALTAFYLARLPSCQAGASTLPSRADAAAMRGLRAQQLLAKVC